MKTIIFALISLSWVAQVVGQPSINKSPIPSQVKALQQAITDEIYDYQYQAQFFPQGGPIGEAVSASETRVHIYIKPLIQKGQGEVIYKLMPYGEIFRFFHVHDDGLIVLDGDPEIGFPATQIDRKTIYMDDFTLASMKSAWMKSSFEVHLDPREAMIQEVVRRQKLRNGGFSAWESSRSKVTK
jgi:hypothetical protein